MERAQGTNWGKPLPGEKKMALAPDEQLDGAIDRPASVNTRSLKVWKKEMRPEGMKR
jgi:hypothetical protein